MKRGDVWFSSRFGRDRKVVIVGHDVLTANRSRVLIVPVSDVSSAGILVPAVADEDEEALGVAQVPYVGEVAKATLTKQAGELTPASIWSVDIALRAALDL